MGRILDAINQSVELYKENGFQPNRLRLSPALYHDLCQEIGRQDAASVSGLSVEVLNDLPQENIYIDRVENELTINDQIIFWAP